MLDYVLESRTGIGYALLTLSASKLSIDTSEQSPQRLNLFVQGVVILRVLRLALHQVQQALARLGRDVGHLQFVGIGTVLEQQGCVGFGHVSIAEVREQLFAPAVESVEAYLGMSLLTEYLVQQAHRMDLIIGPKVGGTKFVRQFTERSEPRRQHRFVEVLPEHLTFEFFLHKQRCAVHGKDYSHVPQVVPTAADEVICDLFDKVHGSTCISSLFSAAQI